MILPNKRLKGFTVIELLVVMIIIGILLGVSVAGFQIYRSNTSIQSAFSDFATIFRSTRNTAQNTSVVRANEYLPSVPASDIRWVYYYGFRINNSNNTLVSLICFDVVNTSTTPNSSIKANFVTLPDSCTPTGQPKSLGKVKISQNTCGTFLFETVTGKLVPTSGQQNCDITFTINGVSKNIKISDEGYKE